MDFMGANNDSHNYTSFQIMYNRTMEINQTVTMKNFLEGEPMEAYLSNGSWSNVTNFTDPQPTYISHPHFTYIYVTTTVFYAAVFLFGVIGNLLVIYVVLRNSDMLTATNLFLMNLSVADLLVLLICMPSSLTEFLAKDVWLLGAFMCKLVAHLEFTVAHTSILTILAISFERYYAICCPLEVLYTCTKRRAIKILGCVWLFGTISAIPIVLMTFTEQVVFYTGEQVMVCRSHVNNLLKTSYIIASLVLFFALPLLFLVVLYSFICRQLLKDETGMNGRRKRERQIGNGMGGQATCKQRKRTLNSRKQVIYMLITIIVLFFICLLPFRVVALWLVFISAEQLNALGLEAYLNILAFSRVLFYINSAANPVLYNIVSTKFRDACRRSVACTPEAERRRRTRTFLFYSTSSHRSGFQPKSTYDCEETLSRNNSLAYSVTATGETTTSLLHNELNAVSKTKQETFI